MFERVVVRRPAAAYGAPAVDVGALAEALLFYRHVLLVVDYGGLQALLRHAGPDVIITLVEDGFLKLAYENDTLAIATQNSGTPLERHDACIVGAPRHLLQNAAPHLLIEITGKKGRGTRLANRLIERTEQLKHDETVTAEARTDFVNTSYVQEGARVLLRHFAPEYEGPSTFRLEPDGDQMRVVTDIDFMAANRLYHARVPPEHSNLSQAFLLVHLLGVKTNLLLAAKFGGELAIDDRSAAIMRLNVNALASIANPEPIARFQDLTFDDSRAVGDAVRQGRCTLEDVARLLPKAQRFKEWLQREEVQADLIKAYFREATTHTWVDRLPTKTVRWSVFTALGAVADAAGAGGVGTVAGVAVGAFDTFLLDRLLHGWKPTQFIDSVQTIIARAP